MLEYQDNEAFFVGPASYVIDSKIYGAKVKWLSPGEGSHFSLDAAYKRIDADNTDDGNVLNLGLHIYPTDSIAINIEFGKTQVRTFDYREFSVGVEWFVTSFLALNFGFEAVAAEFPNVLDATMDTSVKYDQYVLGTKFRF